MFNSLKNWFLYRLIKVLDNHYQRLDSPSAAQALERVNSAADDAMFRCSINGVSLLMPARYLRMLPHCHRPTAHQPLNFLVESGHCHWMTGKLAPGGIAVDVGASVGSITAALSKVVGEQGAVFAFEPARHAYSMLQRVVAVNHLTNVTAEQMAISNRKGVALFAEYGIDPTGENPWLPEGSTLMTNVARDSSETTQYEVKTILLDDYFADVSGTIQLIKIDVEGFEVDVLQGARSVIKRHRPYFSIDIHARPDADGDTEPDVKSILSEYQYRFEKLGHVLVAVPV